MRQEEYDLLKAAVRAVAKQELEIEKAQYMLASAQHMLQYEKEEHPELYEMLDLFRIWTEIRDARRQLEDAQKLTGGIRAYLKGRERNTGSGSEEAGYPVCSESYRSVAETLRRKGFREVKS